jgi:hypothetical protein
MRGHKRVLEKSHFMSQLEEFPYNKMDDCIDAVSLALSKLPNPNVDVSKIPLIQSPLHMAGGKANITNR